MHKTTVIMPLYTYLDFFPNAYENLQEQVSTFDLIITTDEQSHEKVKAFLDKGQYIYTQLLIENTRASKAFNRAIEMIQTPYYMNFGADDLLSPLSINLAEEILDHNPEYDVFNTDIQTFGESESIWKGQPVGEILLQTNVVFFSSVVRKSLWEKLGGYDESLAYGVPEDWDFWIKAYRAGAKSYYLPAPLFYYRLHPNNIHKTINPQAERDAWMERVGIHP